MARRTKYWIQKAVKHPGSLRQWLKKRFGSKAFNKDGTIKAEFLRKLRDDIESGRVKVKDRSTWLRRINLALTLKKF